ncbi:MAG: hypothetical protein DHS20C15_05100 [Planctomycetota bacterium]|nr:MAG: hypothetical protein DHS20C15_05100 [Planctomycetota bacterium]
MNPRDDASADDDVNALLEQHLPGLRAWVRLKAGPLVRAREGESDVVQSTCREVLTHADRFVHRGEAQFRRWLYTTALRKILDKHDFHTAARRDARRNTGDGDAALLAVYSQLGTPSGVASAREQLDRIEAAFAELADDERDVVLLSRILGFSRAEVAAELGRSEAGVRNLLHRSLVKLSKRLEA